MSGERPRLLWVNHFAAGPAQGGGTRHVEMAHVLGELGWQVTIAASDFDLHTRRYVRRESARNRKPISEFVGATEILWLWARPYLTNDWRRGLNWLSFSRSLQKAARSRRWDLIIGSSPHLFAAGAASRIAARQRVPFVFEVRDLWPESIVAAGGRKGPAYLVLDHLANHLYRRAERIVVLARGTADSLEQRGFDPQKIVMIPNGVDPDAFAPASSRRSPPTRFVYAGAHGPANGLDLVLHCASHLVHRSDIEFRFVGDGPAKQSLTELCQRLQLSNVQFEPAVPKSRIPRVLQEAEVGLMVLRDAELFSYGVSPNKLFDYFAAGLPVVCNVPGEVAGMVREAGAGENVAPGDARALADSVARMANLSPGQRLEMGAAGRAWVERERSRRTLASRLDATLRQLLPS